MKKKQSKKLMLAKETLIGLEGLVQGGTLVGTGTISAPALCVGSGTGDTSAGFYDNPESCATKTSN